MSGQQRVGGLNDMADFIVAFANIALGQQTKLGFIEPSLGVPSRLQLTPRYVCRVHAGFAGLREH